MPGRLFIFGPARGGAYSRGGAYLREGAYKILENLNNYSSIFNHFLELKISLKLVVVIERKIFEASIAFNHTSVRYPLQISNFLSDFSKFGQRGGGGGALLGGGGFLFLKQNGGGHF